ncbi:MAG: YtxH domain-containing protein [Chloroflexi bacterium]|nr:YtxH domain-containing protein [Chloroflexota bacterium]
MDSNGAKNMGIGILIGAAAGIAAGFLLAPKSGKETREMIRDKAASVRDRLSRKGAQEEEEEMAETR